MTENRNDSMTGDELVEKTAIRTARRCFSRCGWAVFAVAIALLAVSIGLGVLWRRADAALLSFINRYIMILNEALLALLFLLGSLVLIGIPKTPPERQPVKAGFFFTLLCICFAVGTAGNLIGNSWILFWNAVTGSEVVNPIADLLAQIGPWQMILCTGILAPILEEFFFRKVLIDRMYPHGELMSILVSAAFFALFHENFSQLFYAFGVGVLLGYLYCKTRSYLAVTLLHMAFNFIMGVIPSLLSTRVLEFLEIFSTSDSSELLGMLPSLLMEYGIPLAFYMVHTLALNALTVVGVILLIVNLKKVRLQRGEAGLPPSKSAKAAMLNVGVIVCTVTLVVITVSSLFPA